MASNDEEVERIKAEIKSAPADVGHCRDAAMWMGLLVLLSFIVSAALGHMGWAKALIYGFLQCAFFLVLGIGVAMRGRYSWWMLLLLSAPHVLGGALSILRIARLAAEGVIMQHGSELIYDTIAVAKFVMAIVLVWLLFSKTNRERVRPLSFFNRDSAKAS